jgi:putative ABC transport system ATP-binding protein
MTSPSAPPLVELTDVHKTYQMGVQEVRALDGISLTFQTGEFWAIMGSSGSGKSTMLNLLGCLDTPTSGKYRLAGEDIGLMDDNELSHLRLRRLGFIFQSFNLIPQLTVQENIELPLYYLGWEMHDSADRARELAAKVGLEDRMDHRPTELSGGQRQRVAVARALANDPDVLLADEPTGNLDSKTGDQIMEMLCGLHDQGTTILMVTHEPEVALHASHHLLLKDGRIESMDSNTEYTRAAGVSHV